MSAVLAADILAVHSDNVAGDLAALEIGRPVVRANIPEESGSRVELPGGTFVAAGVAAETVGTAAVNVSVHGPAKQFGQHEQHERQDRYAGPYQRVHQEAAE